MTISKFQGKTKEEAIEKAKAEFGPNVVIMNEKEIKPKGLLRFFKSSTYEVTAAVEERDAYVTVANTVSSVGKARENINLAADEEIVIPQPIRTPAREETIKPEIKKASVFPVISETSVQEEESEGKEFRYTSEKEFKERLDNLSEMLELKLGASKEDELKDADNPEDMNFIKIIYSTLLKSGVHEKYVNQILGEVEQLIRQGNNVDLVLPNIYQKLVLKFGQPKTIDISGSKPNVVFFIGPTGVGKTTTIAKIASKYKVEHNKKVAFITADTYRIAATEQLRVYANILDAPMSIVYTTDEINEAIERYLDYDLIFVDTAGFSHKNEQQRKDTKKLLDTAKDEYHKEVYLVLSATTKYEDLVDIIDIYREIAEYKLIFTKLDETSSYGSLLNIKLYSDTSLSYVANGQNVPDDIEVFDTQKIVKLLLGGK